MLFKHTLDQQIMVITQVKMIKSFKNSLSYLHSWLRCAALGVAGILSMIGIAHAGPQIEHWTLSNGAKVYLVQSHSLPMLDVSIAFDGGSRRDPAAKAGLASFAALMADKGILAGKDAASGPALDENALSDAWLDLGAQFEISAGRDEFGYTMRTLTYPDVLPQASALAARVIGRPSFPADVLKREQARAVAALKESLTQPSTVAARTYYEAVYSGHPYGVLSTEKTLQAITAGDLKAFHAQYVLPCRARISMVGNVTREQAENIAQEMLVYLPQLASCTELPDVAEVPELQHEIDKNVPFKAAQAQILIGQPGVKRSDPDYLTLVVGNHILGGSGFSSRLMQQVREERGLTYGVGSYFSPGAHAGAFTISLNTRPDQAQEALKVTRQVLADFVAQGPTAAELQAAKANLLGGFPLMFDSNAKLLQQVANIARNDLPLDYLDQWPQLIEAVSIEQVKQAFERVVHPDKMVTVVVGAQE